MMCPFTVMMQVTRGKPAKDYAEKLDKTMECKMAACGTFEKVSGKCSILAIAEALRLIAERLRQLKVSSAR